MHGLVKQVTENGQIHTIMEFVNPLIMPNPYNITTPFQGYSPYVNLTIGSYAYFMVASYTEANTIASVTYSNGTIISAPMMMYHGDNRMIISKPVYIQDGNAPYPQNLLSSPYTIQKFSSSLTTPLSATSSSTTPLSTIAVFLSFTAVSVIAVVKRKIHRDE